MNNYDTDPLSSFGQRCEQGRQSTNRPCRPRQSLRPQFFLRKIRGFTGGQSFNGYAGGSRRVNSEKSSFPTGDLSLSLPLPTYLAAAQNVYNVYNINNNYTNRRRNNRTTDNIGSHCIIAGDKGGEQ